MLASVKFIFIALMSTLSYRCSGQVVSGTDTLTTNEEQELIRASRNSTFFTYWLADSMGKARDSVGAGEALLKIDPYYLLFENVVPDSVLSYVEQFNAVVGARTKYVKLFARAYYEKKSIVYERFKKMKEEDQLIRMKMDTCKTAVCFEETQSEMHYTDSVHFAFLYDYVTKNGWPSLADGSMYACVLAIHDHAHHRDYIPLLKQAVRDGKADLSVLKLIIYWYTSRGKYRDIPKYLSTHKHVLFSVNSLLDNKMPGNKSRIEYFIKKHCPAEWFYICECRDYKKESVKINQIFAHDGIDRGSQHAFSKLWADLVRYNCNSGHYNPDNKNDGLWWVAWQPAEHEDLKLSLCVVFNREDSTNFNALLSGDTLVAHAINFDVAKTRLKPEGLEFIRTLAIWLKANPTIKLEVAGHTDIDGTPENNLRLSKARADEICKLLIKLGISVNRLSAKGYGDTKPKRPNFTPEEKAANRRVEFVKL